MRMNKRKPISARTIVTVVALVCLAFATVDASGAPSSRALRSMARVNMAFGKYDEAQTLAKQALNQTKRHIGQDDELAMCFIDLGTVYQRQGRLAEAQINLERGIAIQKNLPEENPYIAYTLRMLGSVYRKQQQYDKAQRVLTEAIEIMLRTNQPEDASLSLFYAEQANLFAETGRLDKADDIYTKAIEVIEVIYGAEHLCMANILEDAAKLDLKLNRLDDAKKRIETTIRIRQKYFGTDHHTLVGAWLTKARISWARGDMVEIENDFAQAVKASAKTKDTVKLATLYQSIAKIRAGKQIAKL